MWISKNVSINQLALTVAYNQLSSMTTMITKKLSQSLTIVALGLAIFQTNAQLPEQNYVRAHTYQDEKDLSEVDTEAESMALPARDVTVNTQYYDLIGRETQSVIYRGTNDEQDFIRYRTYDLYGRPVNQYLPYRRTTQANGDLDEDAALNQADFYNALHGDGTPYHYTDYEKSPLNRVRNQFGPGDAWASNPVSYTYSTNDAEDKVIRWKLNEHGLPYNEPGSAMYYPDDKLNKKTTTDENGNQSIEYTDFRGNVILLKQESGVEEHPWYYTYYVYDNFNRLTYVIPPKFFEINSTLPIIPEDYYVEDLDYFETNQTITGTPEKSVMVKDGHSITLTEGFDYGDGGQENPWTGFIGSPHLDLNILDGLAYHYLYDGRDRMVGKKIPGADWVFLVYDNWDRIVLSQTGNQREADQWHFIKYDEFNRPVLTGFITDDRDYKEIQQAIASEPNRFESFDHTQQYQYTTENTFPRTERIDEVLTVDFYDNYDFTTAEFQIPVGVFEDTENLIVPAKQERVKGKVTGQWVKFEGNFLETVIFYDHRFRIIQEVIDLPEEGMDVITTQYDFAGNIRKVHQNHDYPIASSSHTVLSRYEYDHANRLEEGYHKVDDHPEVLLFKNTYDHLGQKSEKGLYSTDDGSTFSQVVNYDYNIRGRLKGMNQREGVLVSNFEDYFDMTLYYESPLNANGEPQFNDNISSLEWKSPFEAQQSFSYTYDKRDRITAADYLSNGSLNNNYDVQSVSYDAHGNIQTLQRRGEVEDGVFGLMDSLTYTYNGTDQLLRVENGTDGYYGFQNGYNEGDDYQYDANGNLLIDSNKGISNVEYNFLNLPTHIEMDNMTIEYLYDADGRKKSSIVGQSGDISRTDFVGIFIYQDSVLKAIQHQEGRILVPGGDQFDYQLDLKDQLENTRVTINAEQIISTYFATSEIENATLEETVFHQVAETRQMDMLFNHTSGGNESARLNVADSLIIGPAKSLEVHNGDTVKIEVYAKYPHKANTGNTVPGIFDLVTQAFGMAPTAENLNSYLGLFDALGSGTASLFNFSGDPDIPKAYLTFMFFDKEYVLQYGGFQQVSESGENTFEKLELDFVADQQGYLYIYVANETEENLNVYFDDLLIQHIEYPVVQSDDYYPFGETFNGYDKNNWYYKGSYAQSGMGWKDLGFRNYMADLGRFHAVDPLSELQLTESTYQFAGNNPIKNVDVLGLKIWPWQNAGAEQLNPRNDLYSKSGSRTLNTHGQEGNTPGPGGDPRRPRGAGSQAKAQRTNKQGTTIVDLAFFQSRLSRDHKKGPNYSFSYSGTKRYQNPLNQVRVIQEKVDLQNSPLTMGSDNPTAIERLIGEALSSTRTDRIIQKKSATSKVDNLQRRAVYELVERKSNELEAGPISTTQLQQNIISAETVIISEEDDERKLWSTWPEHAKAASLLRKHLSDLEIFSSVKALVNKPDGTSEVFVTIDYNENEKVDFVIAEFDDETDFFKVLITDFGINYADFLSEFSDNWIDKIYWAWSARADRFAAGETYSSVYIEVGSRIAASYAFTLYGWWTDEDLLNGEDLVWWEHALGVLDFAEVGTVSKAAIGLVAIKIGGQTLRFGELAYETRKLLANAFSNGITFNIVDGALTLEKAGEQIGRIVNGVLEPTKILTEGTKLGELVNGYYLAVKDGTIGFLKATGISESLSEFLGKGLAQKLDEIAASWTAYYPKVFFERRLFEEMMGHFRYAKSNRWSHTGDISPNFKAIDFYQVASEVDDVIVASKVVSMKTTTVTNVSTWLNSDPIQKNIRFLREGAEFGLESNGKKVFYENPEIHVYFPQEKFSQSLKTEWLNVLNESYPDIKFVLSTLEEFIN